WTGHASSRYLESPGVPRRELGKPTRLGRKRGQNTNLRHCRRTRLSRRDLRRRLDKLPHQQRQLAQPPTPPRSREQPTPPTSVESDADVSMPDGEIPTPTPARKPETFSTPTFRGHSKQ
ncbi:unnamed protein product, partial [Ectocarpus sp. 12 AP-2014]